jgi:hypothetical protein
MGSRLLVGFIGLAVIAAGVGCGVSQGSHVRLTGKTGSEVSEEEAPNLPPTTAEVEQGRRAEARREGRLRQLSCRELQGHHWSCLLRFADGAVVLEQAVWYGAQRSLGISVVARKGHVELNPRLAPSRSERHGSRPGKPARARGEDRQVGM